MYAIEMKQIVKKFGNFTANDHIDLRVEEGEIHSLLGENGAGKTTIMNILYGLYSADEGEIFLHGKEVRIKSPSDAIRNGISMVHQHFMLVDAMTVAENVVLGSEPHRGIHFDMKKACQEVQEISDKYGLKVNPRDRVGTLPVGVKQRVEILKALYHKSDILILDEPTAVLTPQEVEEFFKVLKQLKSQGKTIIIITHKLKETIEIADSLTILRKGKFILRRPVRGADEKELAEQMVGRIVSFEVVRENTAGTGKTALALEHITYKDKKRTCLDDISLELKYGEILGIAGVEGNGQTELINTVTGLVKPTEGKIFLDEKEISAGSASRFLQAGIANIPEERGVRGGVGDFTLWENYILGYHRRKENQKNGILNIRAIKRDVEKEVENYQIRCDTIDNTLRELSGGNQQKLIVARALSHEPKVIIAAQPTRGVDIGAIEYIHQKLMEFRNQGNAILLISADLDEVVKLSDRIAVIYGGRIVATRPTGMFTEAQLGSYMLGNAESAGEVV